MMSRLSICKPVKRGTDRLSAIDSLLLNFLKSDWLTDYTQLRKKQQSGSAARPRLSSSRSKSDQYGPILADPSDNEVLTIGAEPVRREGGCSRTRLTFSRSVEAIPSDLPLSFSLSFVSLSHPSFFLSSPAHSPTSLLSRIVSGFSIIVRYRAP